MKRKKLIIIPFFLWISIFFSCNQEPDLIFLKENSISGIVDSVVIYTRWEPRSHYVWIDSTKFYLATNYYGDFVRYVEKDDSVYKDKNRWDIYVYKKKNDKLVEKYFKGAQGYLD